MAASFMGCTRATMEPDLSPVNAVTSAKTNPKAEAMAMLLRAIFCSRPRSRYQAETPTTNRAASTNDEVTVWKNLLTATGDSATAENEVISLRTVSRLKSQPTGYCIHELATRIHQAERLAPTAVSHVAVRWKPRLTLRQPKNITAMKVDSRKKAKMPSMASGAPKMSPTKWE
jgi:hypothetical protein